MQDKVDNFLNSKVDPSWLLLLKEALLKLDPSYLKFILEDTSYIPNRNNIFNAFKTLPKEKVKYILFGQDPYPRKESAIGYAFIDGAVKSIFSQNGLSKEVNRATSLRNFIKMALVADKRLSLNNTSQQAIASIDKHELINSIMELKDNFEKEGILLLNTALVFTDKKESKKHIRAWEPFIRYLLKNLNSDIKLILFGNHAKEIIKKFNPKQQSTLLPHPYNTSFISLAECHNLFGKFKLLQK